MKAESKYLPLLNIIAEEAYKNGSGRVVFEIIEPVIENLKKKYSIIEQFDFKKEARQELVSAGAAFIKIDSSNNLYKDAGLTKREIIEQIASISPKIPKKIQNIFRLNLEEIFKTALDIHEGQPVHISGEREHLPSIVRLVDWLYSVNKSKLVQVSLTEPREVNSNIAFYKYAKNDLIGKFWESSVAAQKEFLERDTALLQLRGNDPELYKDIDSKRLIADIKPLQEATKEYSDRKITETPWLIYYSPTVKSVKFSYPEYTNPIKALEHAYKDALKINRVGKLKEHLEALKLRAEKMNRLLEDGFRTIHYVSVDPKTKMPNGKTDFKIGFQTLFLLVQA